PAVPHLRNTSTVAPPLRYDVLETRVGRRAASSPSRRGRGVRDRKRGGAVAEKVELTQPWMVAVWPGMGRVALNAGFYLMAKLGMTAVAEFEAADLFDVEHVEVKRGIVQPGRRPRNAVFVWVDPNKRHDLVLFLGEAQPPLGKYPFCRQL